MSAGRLTRVLIIVQNLPVPFDRRVWLEATTLVRAGYEVSVICPKGGTHVDSYEVLEGVRIYRYSIPGEATGFLGYAFEFVWCFVRTLMKSLRVGVFGPGFDVIHACNPPDTYWLLAQIWRLGGKRFLFDHHDLSPEMFRVKFAGRFPAAQKALLWLEQLTFKTASVVIATNESHKRIAIERGGVSEDRVFVVRSGPALERLVVRTPDPGWKRGKRFLVAYLGEMCEQDGVDYLVRAVGELTNTHGRTDFHTIFVGGGPHQAEIQRYAERLELSDMCTFTGRVSDALLCEILSSADVAVDPDPKNEWSDKSTMNKIMEYMFFGLPIACFDLTENRYSAGEAAIYATPNEEASLAASIHALLEDGHLRTRLGETGRDRMRDSLAWEYSVPYLLAAYERALA